MQRSAVSLAKAFFCWFVFYTLALEPNAISVPRLPGAEQAPGWETQPLASFKAKLQDLG